jgi:hypothetical protein
MPREVAFVSLALSSNLERLTGKPITTAGQIIQPIQQGGRVFLHKSQMYVSVMLNSHPQQQLYKL